MTGIASVGSVGAGLSQAQFQVQYQVNLLKDQQKVAKALGAVALDLIRSVTATATSGAQRHDLDVKA
jgi:hypothetical protein